MASQAQSVANCANAQLSTGPKTAAGKQAVAQNGLSHGLSSAKFAVLPHENPAEYQALLESLQAEFAPHTAAETFLVEEMARAQWKLRRITAMEHQLLSAEGDLAKWFKEDCSQDEVLLKLSRYESTARRAWYKALAELGKLRSGRSLVQGREIDAAFRRSIGDDIALSNARLAEPHEICKANPLPLHLEAEWKSHKRRDPDFDPKLDRSQMSGQLQRWFDKHQL
jgi:hypothetical protein